LSGQGAVFLGANTLTIGSNNQSTTFSGVIQNSGAVTKSGTGTLTLTGANTYTGNTTVTSGVLRISNRRGSGTGTGSVNVQTGTLGGKGLISGPITLGTGSGSGAVLAPSVAAQQSVTLSCKKTLTFKSDSTYTCLLDTRNATADEMIAKGVTIEAGAQFDLQAVANKRLTSGMVFTVLSNTPANPISGNFANLADGTTLTVGRSQLKASYEGGDGNDLTLTVQ
jgi:autotransporter-associated beta strand protein